MTSLSRKVSVIGLGYVGLPVAVAFGRISKVIGFDINQKRIKDLKNGIDETHEATTEDLKFSNILFTTNKNDLKKANFHIIAVPTPVDQIDKPDLNPLISASEIVGSILKKNDIVVYESTVYPGATEEECVPVLEAMSGLKFGKDFTVGYSPERINPGDKEHVFSKIKKIVSGSDSTTRETIASIYGAVVSAGVHKASSIRVAEAAKVIENTQRDLNIAFVNELAIIFNILGIDTKEVLDAAETKWNFLKFRPGLVGGHCIGVDPYYLTHQSQKHGYIPQVILAGRRINNEMGKYIAQQTIKEMIHAGHIIKSNTVTVLGLTFKENCNDIRNSKVVDIIHELEAYKINVQIADPYANANKALKTYGIKLSKFTDLKPADALIVAVAHDEYKKLSPLQIKSLLKRNSPVFIDVKSIYKPFELVPLGISYWNL